MFNNLGGAKHLKCPPYITIYDYAHIGYIILILTIEYTFFIL